MEMVWRNGTQAPISNPSRTIVDLFNDPKTGGGILAVSDMYGEYLRSKYADHHQLISLAERMENRAIFKRMGFLTELLAPGATDLIEACHVRISGGYAQLDPAVKGQTTITRWHLHVPQPYDKGIPN